MLRPHYELSTGLFMESSASALSLRHGAGRQCRSASNQPRSERRLAPPFLCTVAVLQILKGHKNQSEKWQSNPGRAPRRGRKIQGTLDIEKLGGQAAVVPWVWQATRAVPGITGGRTRSR